MAINHGRFPMFPVNNLNLPEVPVFLRVLFAFALIITWTAKTSAQSGRHTIPAGAGGAVMLGVVAVRDNTNAQPGNQQKSQQKNQQKIVTANEVSLYDNGIEQTIQSFSPDPGPARIVLLVDNSLSLRADVKKLEQAAREFAYEIYKGDQVMIVGFDEKPEIILDWTDDAKKVESSLRNFRKKGEPFLFDALSATISDALQPFKTASSKRIIVVVSDGLDRGSKITFDDVQTELQSEDITLYALQLPDRSGGAFRRGKPKAPEVIRKLTEGTGGRIVSFEEPREAAASICDELRKERYLLAYTPTGIIYGEPRRLLVAGNTGIVFRAKTAQP
ncbi:MAG: VWA domain-containing protein [Pyrinomonadaceae bacterium]